MKLFGITGGIGMGKSTTGEILAVAGYPIIDTDTIAHQIVEPNQPALSEIISVFGNDMLDENGFLRRDLLAKKVFSDTKALQKLESILHPRIRTVWQNAVEEWRQRQNPIGFVIIPLLFETGAEQFFDGVLCVACAPATQKLRLRQRGWSDEQIDQRIAAQWSTDKKMDRANFVVWTETTLEIHAAQLARVCSSFVDGVLKFNVPIK